MDSKGSVHNDCYALERLSEQINRFSDIAQIIVYNDGLVIGLNKYGILQVASINDKLYPHKNKNNNTVIKEIQKWSDIIQIIVSGHVIIGLKSYGSLVFAGKDKLKLETDYAHKKSVIKSIKYLQHFSYGHHIITAITQSGEIFELSSEKQNKITDNKTFRIFSSIEEYWKNRNENHIRYIDALEQIKSLEKEKAELKFYEGKKKREIEKKLKF